MEAFRPELMRPHPTPPCLKKGCREREEKEGREEYVSILYFSELCAHRTRGIAAQAQAFQRMLLHAAPP